MRRTRPRPARRTARTASEARAAAADALARRFQSLLPSRAHWLAFAPWLGTSPQKR